jgi:hypothetical protein
MNLGRGKSVRMDVMDDMDGMDVMDKDCFNLYVPLVL